MFLALSPLLERLGKCGLCVVYKMGVGLGEGGGVKVGFSRFIMGRGGVRGSGPEVFLPEGKNAIKSLKTSHHQSL